MSLEQVGSIVKNIRNEIPAHSEQEAEPMPGREKPGVEQPRQVDEEGVLGRVVARAQNAAKA